MCAGRTGNFLLRKVRSWGLYLQPPNSQALRARIFLRNGSMALLHAFPPLLLLDWAALWKATGIVQVVGPLQNSSLRSGLRPNLPGPSRALPPTARDVCLGLCGFLCEAFRGGCLVPGSCWASLGARTPISANPGAQLALCERDLTVRIMPGSLSALGTCPEQSHGHYYITIPSFVFPVSPLDIHGLQPPVPGSCE